jgi:hypothetical protein
MTVAVMLAAASFKMASVSCAPVQSIADDAASVVSAGIPIVPVNAASVVSAGDPIVPVNLAPPVPIVPFNLAPPVPINFPAPFRGAASTQAELPFLPERKEVGNFFTRLGDGISGQAARQLGRTQAALDEFAGRVQTLTAENQQWAQAFTDLRNNLLLQIETERTQHQKEMVSTSLVFTDIRTVR